MNEIKDQNSIENRNEQINNLSIGTVVMIEHSAENYFSENMEMIKNLTNSGFVGLYISFQRPFVNVNSFFIENGIDVNKLRFIDAASAFTGEKQVQDEKCITIKENIEIDELVQAIYTSLPDLQGDKQFIFIDSLTTIALYKPLSETMRFSEFLVRTIKEENHHASLIFNVASDLAQKKFIKDIAFRVDQVIG
jgi:KaiC/GvpD/RAD55 family RecA-like ATPase